MVEVENLQSIVSLFLDFLQNKSFERPLGAHQSEPLSTCTSTYEAWIAQPQSKWLPVQRDSWNPRTPWFLGGKTLPHFTHKIASFFRSLKAPESAQGQRERVSHVLAKTPAVSGLTNPSAWNSSHMLNGCRVAAKDTHSRDWLIAVKKNDKWTKISWFSGG